VVQDGYEFFANRRLVTIFSAPHYCGQFDNAAATMAVAEDLSCSFSVYRPTAKAVRRLSKPKIEPTPLVSLPSPLIFSAQQQQFSKPSLSSNRQPQPQRQNSVYLSPQQPSRQNSAYLPVRK
uniref:Uncharacterized protein n=1 Tax=Panagrolaimus sp. PS1159 TaxID=55785 RepID=A0AC35FCI8_9BILA